MENFGSGPSLHPAPHCTTTGEWRVLNCKKTQQYFVFGSSTLSKISNPKPPPTSFRILQQQPPGGTYPTNGKRKPHTQKYLGIWFLSSQQLICMINQDYICIYIYNPISLLDILVSRRVVFLLTRNAVSTWRIISGIVSGLVVNPPFISHKVRPFGRGLPTRSLGKLRSACLEKAHILTDGSL